MSARARRIIQGSTQMIMVSVIAAVRECSLPEG